MTPDELKQFTELAKKYEEKDQPEIIKVLESHIHPVFQEVNDRGRTAANNDNKAKLTAAEKKEQDLTVARDALKKQLDDLEGKAPDAVKLKERYEAEVKTTRDDLTNKLTQKDQELAEEQLENAKAKLVDALVKQKINRKYAETIVVKDDTVLARLKPLGKGKVDVLKAGSKDVTLVPTSDKTALDLLAEELAPPIPDEWKVSGVKRGSGMTGANGGGGSESGKEAHFNSIREEVKTKTKEQKAKGAGRSGYERISGRSR